MVVIVVAGARGVGGEMSAGRAADGWWRESFLLLFLLEYALLAAAFLLLPVLVLLREEGAGADGDVGKLDEVRDAEVVELDFSGHRQDGWCWNARSSRGEERWRDAVYESEERVDREREASASLIYVRAAATRHTR